jgi:cyclophilin family peptidyl-prolyl cis-trans isomerase
MTTRPAAILLLLVAACGGQAATGGSAGGRTPSACQNAGEKIVHEPKQLPPSVIDPCQSYSASVITARGTFVIKLDPVAAPVTVNNFVFLSEHAFYNHLTFHRVEDFVVQGGDPKGDGTGGPGYSLPSERNSGQWLRGAVGMAAGGGSVNGSQFFVLKKDSQYLSGTGVYNHFGTVTAGMDVVDQIQKGDQIVGINVASG